MPFSCWIWQKKIHKENLRDIVHNSFSLIDFFHSFPGGSLLIPKGRICRPVVVDDGNDDTSMVMMIVLDQSPFHDGLLS